MCIICNLQSNIQGSRLKSNNIQKRGIQMNQAVVRNVLGEENASLIHEQIEMARNICRSIRNEGSDGRGSQCQHISSNIPTVIRELSTSFQLNRSRIDIAHRITKMSHEATEVRGFMINLFTNLNGLSIAIDSHNDGTLNEYNRALEEALEIYY